jgi:hypothetical protein
VPPPPVSASDNSMVPPEVVPLTPPPAPAGAEQFGANAPGLTSPEQVAGGGAGPATALGGMQSAKQARQTAFNALMGDQQWSPQLNEELQAQANARATAAAAAQPGGTNGMLANNAQQQAQTGGDYSESQTLTGGVKYQQNYQNTQRSGFTNATSSSLGLMSGYANPSNLSTAGASNGLGLPFFLLGATGLGIRNGFRW